MMPDEKLRSIADIEKAAMQGDKAAQVNLGICYYKGEGVAQNYKKAAEWYERAASKGSIEAQY
ncbi:MAG: hypothetical protein FWC41_10215, partial [Firmicutes bacterium]|nr:hypothetical protein [Bacillota bacterium]